MNQFWKGKRVFLTGHTGFKGSWLSLSLLELGAEVTGYSLLPPSSPSLFGLAHLSEQMTSIIGDIRDLEMLKREVSRAKPDIFFHLAAQALVRSSYEDPVGTYATNVMGTVNVFEALRQSAQTKVLVNVTSDKCYENREWSWGYRENEAMGGYDPYSSSKGCAELVSAAYRRSFFTGIGIATARAGNVIGGGDWAKDRLVPDCIRQLSRSEPVLIRNPDAIRPWQHVLEPLSGYLLLAQKLWESPAEYSEGWNFGPAQDDAKPVRWIADKMVQSWGGSARWKDESSPLHEAHYLKLDCSLAAARLGWRPRLNLTQCLEWVVQWYRDQSAGQSALMLTQSQIRQYLRLLQ